MDWAKFVSYLSLATTLITGLATIVHPGVQLFWATHPAIAGPVAALLAAVNLFLPQPHK